MITVSNKDIPIAIKAVNLQRMFGKTAAVDGISFEVKRGELFGIVGPDGAGKTTTMRMLAGILTPSGGEAIVHGFDIKKDAEKIKENIAYLAQKFGLYEDLTVIENIDFYADLYGVPKKERAAKTERLLQMTRMSAFKDRLAGKLSGGMKQKLALICALIHTPKILFLDEPTNGVDPISRRDFWKILYELLREKLTIFVSTAYLDEAERCARAALIHKGKILILDEPTRIKKSIDCAMFEISADNTRHALDFLRAESSVKVINLYGEKIHAGFTNLAAADTAVNELKAKGINIIERRPITPSLEDVFISLVSEK